MPPLNGFEGSGHRRSWGDDGELAAPSPGGLADVSQEAALRCSADEGHRPGQRTALLSPYNPQLGKRGDLGFKVSLTLGSPHLAVWTWLPWGVRRLPPQSGSEAGLRAHLTAPGLPPASPDLQRPSSVPAPPGTLSKVDREWRGGKRKIIKQK